MALSSDSGGETSRKGAERPSDQFAYGQWQGFYASFAFEADELKPDVDLHIQLDGPEAGVDIEIDDVTFSLPPPSIVPDPDNVCGGNLIMNGDKGESLIHPYPMEVIGNGRISVHTEGVTEKRFFRTEFRSSDTDSIAQKMDAPGCFVHGARYRIAAKVRVQSVDSVQTLVVCQVIYQDGEKSRFVAAECPGSNETDFERCKSVFLVPDDFDADRVEDVCFSFETIGGQNNDLDVMDWRLELVEASTPTIIVQEEGVKDCWNKGAEILITSHTTDFESAQVRRLVASPQSYEDGLVQLHLNETIIPPVTVRDGDGFAVEVALLSRNIVFEGAKDESNTLFGGHLIVMNTPSVPQLIEGVEFRNFGRQGKNGLERRLSFLLYDFH
jgi:hypothetical protein